MIKHISPSLLFRLVALVAVCILISRFVLPAASAASQADDYSVTWYTFDGGGGASTGGDYIIMGTIGQPDAGQHDDGVTTYDLTGGFWTWVARYLGYLPLIKKP